MSIKTIARGLVVACCAALGLTALAEAPTPVVVFNGDLINGAHKNGKYAVTADASQNVTIANGFATTTKVQGTGGYDSHGIQISWDAEDTPGTQMTVLVKYSGYAKDSGRTSIFSTLWGDHNTTFSQTWDNKFEASYDVSNADADPADAKTRKNNDATPIPASGVLMFGLCSDDSDTNIRGARVAFQEEVEGETKLVEKFRWDGLRWKNAKFGNFYIAGTLGRRNRYYRPAMTVEAVAIFNKTLTVDEANEYVFPTLHRITDVSGEVSWNDLMEGRNFVNGDDVAIVMSGSSTITLPETPVLPGSFSVFGTGDMTIPAMNFPVVSGTQVIWARGFSGEALTKEGTNRLRIQNGDDNGSAETYEDIALDGTTVNIIDGTVELCNGHNNDARFNNATFNIGTYGDLDCYGWIYGKGTMTIENASDKTILTNRGNNNSNLADVPNIVKKGAGKLTMTCNLNSGNATSSTIDIQSGTLCLKNTNNKTLNGAITGAGSLEIDVGADHSVKLGSNANTMASIIVTSGALDVAGQKPSTPYTIVAKGGTIKSSGSHIYANENSIKSLTLEADSSLTGGHRFGLTTSNGAETTLDLGEHTLTIANGTTDHCIGFRNTTVTGIGTIAIDDNSFMLVYDSGNGSMTAEDATLTMAATSKLELNMGGTLTVKDFEAADGATIICGNAKQGTLKVLGTYKNTNNIPKLELANGATIDIASIPENGVVASATQTLTIDDIATIKLAIAGTETTDYTLSIGEGGKSVVATPVKTATELFLEAVAAAESGATVKVTEDITLGTKLEVNGKAITIDADSAVTITGQLRAVNGATLTIGSNVTVTSDKHPTLFVLGDPAVKTAGTSKTTVIVNGTILNTNAAFDETYAISGNGTDTQGVDLTINGTVSNANGTAIYWPNKGSLTINAGSAITGAAYGVYAKSGSVTINGGTITSTATEIVDPSVNNNGSDGKGYALVLEKLAPGEGGYADNLTCDITGGTFEGVTAILSWARTSSVRLTKFVDDGVTLTETTPSAADIKKSYKEGPTSWDDIKEGDDVTTIITLPEGQEETSITATELKAWAEKTGATFGETIPVNALILNCAPTADAMATAENAVVVDDKTMDAIMAAVAAGTDPTSIEIPAEVKAKYPMAKIELVESTKIQSTETAKFFQLKLTLK